jgi:hypothetical protein
MWMKTVFSAPLHFLEGLENNVTFEEKVTTITMCNDLYAVSMLNQFP